MTTHNRVQELRRAGGFRQKDLAARAGLSQPTLSQIENGKLPLSINLMRSIAQILGCAPADLLGPRDNPERLTAEERKVLMLFRTAGRRERAMIGRLLEPGD